MAFNRINIEIDEQIIKVCQADVQKNGTLARMEHGFWLKTPEQCVYDGVVKESKQIAELIANALRRRAIRARKVSFSLVSSRIATREITLPPVKSNKVGEIIHENIKDYFPVDIEEYEIGYQIVESTEEKTRVILFAAPQELIESYYTLAQLLKLQIASIDYSGNMIFQLLRGIPDNRVTAYVNIDACNSMLTVIQEGKLLLQRSFPCGGDELARYYLQALELPEEEYVNAYVNLNQADELTGMGAISANDVADRLSRVLENIKRAVDYFNSSFWATPIEHIVLTGLCSNFFGLSEQIQQFTHLPTVMMLTDAHVTVRRGVQGVITQYVGCAGYTMHSVDFRHKKQIKPKKETQDGEQSKKRISLYICIGGILISAALAGTSFASYQSAKKQLQTMQEEIDTLQEAEKVYLMYQDYHTTLTGLEEFAQLSQSPNESLLAFIEELEQKMPSQIRILNAACEKTGVTMNITVANKQQAAAVIVQLRTFESIDTIEVGALTDGVGETGIREVNFTVNCTYHWQDQAEAILQAQQAANTQEEEEEP